MLDKQCKKCREKLGGSYSEVLESRLYVVVDEKLQEATILFKGDCLCDKCGKVVIYYKRLE